MDTQELESLYPFHPISMHVKGRVCRSPGCPDAYYYYILVVLRTRLFSKVHQGLLLLPVGYQALIQNQNSVVIFQLDYWVKGVFWCEVVC